MYAQKELNEIEKKRAYLEDRISKYPSGELSFRANGKYKKWYIRQQMGEKVVYKHISSKNKEMLSVMSLKKLDTILY